LDAYDVDFFYIGDLEKSDIARCRLANIGLADLNIALLAGLSVAALAAMLIWIS